MSPRARPPGAGHEKGLVGLWYRCEAHGLTQEPVLLGAHPYCPADGCSLAARLVHTVLDDARGTEWNQFQGPGSAARPGRPRRQEKAVAETTEVVGAAPMTPERRRRRRELLRAAAAEARRRRRRIGHEDSAGTQGTGRRETRRSPPKGPASTAPALSPGRPDAPVRGASTGPDVVRVVDPGRGRWHCEVCQRRRRGRCVAIESADLSVRVCAPCAAEGDPAMRAAAAPLLVRSRAS